MTEFFFLGILDRNAAVVGALSLFACATATAADDASDNRWRYTLAPYVWVGGINGDVTIKNQVVTIHKDGGYHDRDDWKFGGTLGLEAQKGKWSVLGELMYLDLKIDDIRLPSGSPIPQPPPGFAESMEGSFTQTVFSAAVARALQRSAASSFDVMAGLRYVHLDIDLGLNAGPAIGNLSDTEEWVDPFIGARGQFNLTEHWLIPYSLDVGGFSVGSRLTWQGFAGVGYKFRWGDAILAYRDLDIDYKHGSFSYKSPTRGPALGVAFHF